MYFLIEYTYSENLEEYHNSPLDTIPTELAAGFLSNTQSAYIFSPKLFAMCVDMKIVEVKVELLGLEVLHDATLQMKFDTFRLTFHNTALPTFRDQTYG